MTEKQINIAIAEVCGWRQSQARHPKSGRLVTIWTDGKSDFDHNRKLPNYCKDLNAMRDAEMTLLIEGKNRQQWENSRSEFRWRLRLLCIEPIHASARARAEAFLKTVGKWEEES
jgi:hypothetical protein